MSEEKIQTGEENTTVEEVKSEEIEKTSEKAETRSKYYEEDDELDHPRKKKKKGLIIAISVVLGLILIAGGVLLTFYLTQKEVFLNTYALFTKDDNAYFHYVLDRKVADLKTESKAAAEKVKDVKVPESFETKGTVDLSISEEFASLFIKDFAGLDDLQIKYDLALDKDKFIGGSVTTAYKGVDLISIEGEYRKDTGKTYISIPSYKPQVIDLSAFLEKEKEKAGKAAANDMADTDGSGDKDILAAIASINLEDLINEEEFAKFISSSLKKSSENIAEQFLDFVNDRISEVELQKDIKVTVNGIENEYNIITATLSHEKVKDFINDRVDSLQKILKTLAGSINTKAFGLDLEALIDSFRKTFDNTINQTKMSVETKLYVDNKGYIPGGSFKILIDGLNIPVGTTNLKMDGIGFQVNLLREKDENNPDRSTLNGDVSIIFQKMPISLFSFSNVTEKKEKGDLFDLSITVSDKLSSLLSSLPVSIKEMLPGSIGSILEEIPHYSLEIKGESENAEQDTCKTKLSVIIRKEGKDSLNLGLMNEFIGTTPKDPMNITEENLLDVYDIPESGYIELTEIVRMILNKIDEINDENVNNFLNETITGFLKSILGNILDELPPMVSAIAAPITDKIEAGDGIGALKDILDAGILGLGDNFIKKELNVFLGIEQPYNYGKLMEDPRHDDDDRYVYSWDVLKDNDFSYENIEFNVYDYFPEPETHEVDIEKEKEKFLRQYAGQTYTAPAEPGEGIQMGDMITFDAVPIVMGIPVEAYSFPDNTATVGKYEYGEGADDELLGMCVGDEKIVTITVPKDEAYGNFGGMDIDFRVTIKSITKVFGPEWSERFIVGVLGYIRLDVLEMSLWQQAQESLDADVHEPTIEEIKRALIDDLTRKISTDGYSEEVKEQFKEYIKSAFDQAGFDKNIINTEIEGMDPYDYYFAKYALIAEVAYKEGISLNEEDVQNGYDRLAEELGYRKEDSFAKVNETKFGKRFLVDFVIEHLAADIIYEKASINWVV